MNGEHAHPEASAPADHGSQTMRPRTSVPEIVAVALLSFAMLGTGIAASNYAGNLAMSTRTMREEMTFDRRFIDMMVPHHQAAVEMAKMAKRRSEHPEIRALSDEIIRTQSEEIELMRSYRKAWYGSDRTPPLSEMPMVMEGMQMMNDVPMDMQGDLEVLARSPGPFDRAFLDAMIPHHGSAIEASEHAPNLAVHQETVELARRIIAAQRREIEEMRHWRTMWFPGR